MGPRVKIYTINGERSLIGFYPTTEQTMSVGGRDIGLHYPSGWEATTFELDDQLQQPSFASQPHAWFESLWATIGRDYQS